MTVLDAEAFLKTAPLRPGVYVMLDDADTVIYVGKAKNLKKRLSSYFQKDHPDLKTQTLVKHIAKIELTPTRTEKEALLLESNLIKQHKPHYNILFKDDKTYPFVSLTGDKAYPRLAGVRARVMKEGLYFGPYPSMQSVKQTIDILQKTFKIRTCDESYFKHRTRPCLLHQIKRCSAPCVGAISEAQYQEDLNHVKLFLNGKDQSVFKALSTKMDAAAEALDFEKAAYFRDQIKVLRELQESQIVDTQSRRNVDVLAVAREGKAFALLVLVIREGRLLGSREYFPAAGPLDDESSVLSAFIDYHYAREPHEKWPAEWVISHPLLPGAGEDLIATPRCPTRGLPKQWLSLSLTNAREALGRHLLAAGKIQQRLEALKARLHLPTPIERIECFDISHTQGEETVASCVVFSSQGACPQAYRRFNIAGITPGDDYAAMRQVLKRRFSRLQEEGQAYPDLVIIDGGRGQLKQAEEILAELNIIGVTLLSIAKGVTRKAGEEDLWLPGASIPLTLDPHDEAFLLIQYVRDEAHRFAITGHRRRRDRKRSESSLEHVPQLGPKKRQAILKHFGSWEAVCNALPEALAQVTGVSLTLAAQIYAALH